MTTHDVIKIYSAKSKEQEFIDDFEKKHGSGQFMAGSGMPMDGFKIFVSLGLGNMVPGTVEIGMIKVSPEHRGQGIGSKWMKILCQEADERGITLSLECVPSGYDKPLDKDQLKDFYMKYGFGPYKKGKQYSYVLVRKPK